MRVRATRSPGLKLLTFHEVAERFSQVLGTKISYVPADRAAYLAILKRVLPNEWHANAVSELFREIAEGVAPHVTDTFRRLVGRDPISLAQFIRDHIGAFQRLATAACASCCGRFCGLRRSYRVLIRHQRSCRSGASRDRLTRARRAAPRAAAIA